MTQSQTSSDNSFNAQAVEEKVRSFWDKNNCFHAEADPKRDPYTIVIPPPNVTGDLTMGHVLNNSLQDIMIRWNRALGKNVCWVPGTDHASIATEAKVTSMLKEKGINKREIGRENFLKHAWEWKEKYSGRIVSLLKLLGCSCDWQREVFTMDEMYSKNVIKAFVSLFKNGMVYKGNRLVNWCPVSQSVISDEEVYFEERNSSLWHIRYRLEESPKEYLVVATTRPETLFGDLAIAVHPDDERYQKWIGKNVIVPACNRKIPVIADSYVEKDFGTGVLKITPAHDMNDFEVGKRHKLGLLNIMNPDATLNNNVPTEYQNLDRVVARKKLVAELENSDLMEKTEPYLLKVGMSERGHVPIEYYLSEQWYIKMQPLAELALNATRSKKLTLHPPHTEKTWEHWLTNIHDWCVSRQLWWGHRIPIYTCSQCKHVMCEENAPAQCEKCNAKNLVQDPDVLDTWASSWLWPFGVHKWHDQDEQTKKDLAAFYPTDVIITATDIIFFWVARMVMAGEYFMNKTPFHDVYFTPIVRDTQGRKMSKSLGNSPDPLELMKKYGTDALRFAITEQVVMGQDIHWSDKSCEIGRNFSNKVWNAARFLKIFAEKYDVSLEQDFSKITVQQDPLLDWITSEFYQTVNKCHESLKAFKFSEYASSLYHFIWFRYCDWFIELIKPKLNDENKKVAQTTLVTALQVFDGMLKILHPVMPFVTEELWQSFAPTRAGKTVGKEQLPLENRNINLLAISQMDLVQKIVGQIRTLRGQFTIHPGTELKVTLHGPSEKFGKLVPQMEYLARGSFNFESSKPKLYAAALVDDISLYVNLEGLIDAAEETKRLTKRIEKLEQTIQSVNNRLANQDFVKGAPAHILEGARSQLKNNETELTLLRQCLEGIKGA